MHPPGVQEGSPPLAKSSSATDRPWVRGHVGGPRQPSCFRYLLHRRPEIDRSLRGAYVKRSTHCAREAGGSNGAPKTQVVLAILADRTSMMLMTCQVTPSGYLAFPKNV